MALAIEEIMLAANVGGFISLATLGTKIKKMGGKSLHHFFGLIFVHQSRLGGKQLLYQFLLSSILVHWETCGKQWAWHLTEFISGKQSSRKTPR